MLPPGADACPHCGARSRPGLFARAAHVAAAGAAAVTLMACYGAPYDDDGWWGGCQSDWDCGTDMTCDLETGQCVWDTTSTTSSSMLLNEVFCHDGFDDDQDGLLDCLDPDCEHAPGCLGPEACQNGLDDDLDGATDCADLDCPACPSTETWCGNLYDDDMDGLADCDDADCAAECAVAVCGDGALTGLEECDDGNILPDDGCSADCEVEWPASCASLPLLEVGSNAGDTAGGTNVWDASCIPSGGPDRAYAFTAPAAGTLYLTLDAPEDLAIGVFGPCDASAPEIACADDGAGLESLAVALAAGETVTVVVDAATYGLTGSYQLVASFVPQ